MDELKQSLITLDRQYATDFRRRALRSMLLPQVQGPIVLDAGCGMGFMTRALSQQGFEVVALDIDHELVASAIRPDNNAAIATGLTYRDGRLPFRSASFNTVLSLDVIEHIEDDQQMVDEMARVLQPNGRLVLSVPAMPNLYGQRDVAIGHYRRYSPTLLRQRLENAGLRVIQLGFWNILGVLPYYLAEHVFQRPINDSIRQGQPTLSKRVMAEIFKTWLQTEWPLNRYLPAGLSLITIASR